MMMIMVELGAIQWYLESSDVIEESGIVSGRRRKLNGMISMMLESSVKVLW